MDAASKRVAVELRLAAACRDARRAKTAAEAFAAQQLARAARRELEQMPAPFVRAQAVADPHAAPASDAVPRKYRSVAHSPCVPGGRRACVLAVPMAKSDYAMLDELRELMCVDGPLPCRILAVRRSIENLAWLIRNDRPADDPEAWVKEGLAYAKTWPPAYDRLAFWVDALELSDVELLAARLRRPRGAAVLASVRYLHHVYVETT